MWLACLYFWGKQGFALVRRPCNGLLIGRERQNAIKSPNRLKFVAVSCIGCHHLRAQPHPNDVSFNPSVHYAALVHWIDYWGHGLNGGLRKAFITALRIDGMHNALQCELTAHLKHTKYPSILLEAIHQLGHFVDFWKSFNGFDSLPKFLSFLLVLRLLQVGQLVLLTSQLVENQMCLAEERVG